MPGSTPPTVETPPQQAVVPALAQLDASNAVPTGAVPVVAPGAAAALALTVDDVEFAGITWSLADRAATPIGYVLAAELSQRAEQAVAEPDAA